MATSTLSSSSSTKGVTSSGGEASSNTTATTSTDPQQPPFPDARAQAEARAAILASLESSGSHYDSSFQRRAAEIHSNAAAVAKQEAQVKKNTAALAKENAKWQKELDKTTKGLNEFGDLQNWAEMMENDFLVLEETLRLVEGGERVESASGGSQWKAGGDGAR